MTRSEFQKLLTEKIVILDGATGTELVKRGMPQGVCPELWILENPSAMIEIQQAYRAAGSDIVFVPSFGANRFKLEEFGLAGRLAEINRSLAGLSRCAVGDGLVFGDLAPTGKFIEPLGDIPFEDVVNVYKEQVAALLEGNVDGFVIETMMDIQETRAALLAVKESCELPVMVTMTFDEHMRTLTGSDPVSALITLQAMGADAFGCNCSTGPGDMLEIIRTMKPYATIPLIAKPNAGIPKLVSGKTVFDMSPSAFAGYVPELAAAGINIMGGCCGSTPEHIREMALSAARCKQVPPVITALSAVSASRNYCLLGKDKPFAVVGERINPTGKKALQAELREGKLAMVNVFAREQAAAGASILDVNMGLSGIDEKEMMVKAVKMLGSGLPLCIDSTSSEVIEAALRIYPGRALVNSISAEKSRLERTLPAAAKYGAMFILLPLADEGIPETFEGRKEIVEKVFCEAEKYGYSKADICVDGLVMTVSSNQNAARITLDLIEWCSRKFGVNTICGLSNVSFGMPQRAHVNNTFLAMAVGRGLNMAIANPAAEMLMPVVDAGNVLTGRDLKMKRYVEKYGAAGQGCKTVAAVKSDDPAQHVFNCILTGDEESIAGAINKALASGITAKDIVDKSLIPAINRVGELYDCKEYFLPQLIMSADTMRKGFEVLEPLLEENKSENDKPKVVIVLATVEGDIHDIGKNIVALMLRNYGFEVVDLGKDVSARHIVAAAGKHNAAIIGLSALMTTTMVRMTEVIQLAKAEGLDKVKFMVGGAVVDQAYADEIGADAYAPDAMEAVRIAQRFTP
jgi:5-methyltetrahydrofolate--homocysteine methyltransferase